MFARIEMESLKKCQRAREADFVPDERGGFEDSGEHFYGEEAPENRHHRAQPAKRRLSISKLKRKPSTHPKRRKTTENKEYH
jgi:hypothetical protein